MNAHVQNRLTHGWLEGHPIRTARKPHRCNYNWGRLNGGRCKNVIAAGDRYVEGECNEEAGGWGNDRYCFACMARSGYPELGHQLRPYIETIPDAVLCDGWRYAHAKVEERLFFARQDYAAGRTPDAYCLRLYHAAVQDVSEAEEEMDRRGIEYALSSFDWRDDPLLVAAVTCEAMGAA